MAFCIALDGPAGAGKSAVVAAAGRELNMYSLDTGAMYRAMAVYMVRNGIDVTDTDAVAKACADVVISVKYDEKGEQHTLLFDEDVTPLLDTVSKQASAVSQVGAVRERLVALQREIAKSVRMIMDGRDIGTTVLPDAPLKIFLTASAEERANRRVKQLKEKNLPADYDTVLKEIIERDYDDSHRALSPLKKAEDAVEIDTTHMTQDEVVNLVLKLAREAGA